LNDSQLTVELGLRSYPVFFRTAARTELVERLVALAATGRILLVTDETVAALHGDVLVGALGAAGLRVVRAVVPAGESSKTIAGATSVWDAALNGGVDRRTPVVALGGGVVGDLAGFVASTLLRGLPLVQVPTTLMAQVDSSVGGKTGLNHPTGKNLIGTFYQPRFVFSDTAFLETLPARQVRSGLAEVVKHAVLGAPVLLDALAALGPAPTDLVALRQVTRAAVGHKAEIVAADETETGLRAVLNFGHTLGHAFEADAGFEALTHGEAVSLGMCAALELSERLSGLPPRETHRVTGVLAALGLPTDWRAVFTPAVFAHVQRDKKARGDRVKLVLLSRLGESTVVPIHFHDLGSTLTALAAQNTRKTT
jgi:3-dehydroquinate synthase